MDEIYIDLNFLTEAEKDALQDVLARDEEFRRKEKKRLRFVIELKYKLCFVHFGVCFWGLPSKTCDRLNDVLIHLY
jgi:NAD kinase